MTVQFGDTLRNARLDQIETTISTGPILTLRTGAQPANCAAANSGTVVATITLPSDWMNAASGGTKTKLGTWSDASADAGGTIAHWRLHDSTGTVCHAQGSAGTSGTDLILDNNVVLITQTVTITAWTFTEGNP
jgi:hypothetical protein